MDPHGNARTQTSPHAPSVRRVAQVIAPSEPLGCPTRAGFARVGRAVLLGWARGGVHCGRAIPLKRYYGSGDLHFVTFSCYRRMPLVSARRRDLFLRQLESLRQQYRFVVVGYVVMPEHVHLLVSEPERRDLSVVLKALKQAVARRVLAGMPRRSQLQGALFPDIPTHRAYAYREGGLVAVNAMFPPKWARKVQAA